MNAHVSMQQKAEAGWEGNVPDWIAVLADLTEAHGLKQISIRVGVSKATISQAISNTYRADLATVQKKVRGALMGETITCPVLGEIGADTCLDWQAKPRVITNAMRSRVYHACRNGCPFSRLKGERYEA